MNSEIKHEAWYIENPISKELTKRITLKLGPKAEQEFIIVVRSPSQNLKKSGSNMLSIINIGVLTYADEQFGLKDSFEDFLKVNYNNSMKEFLRDRKKLAQLQKVEILLAGRVEVPNLMCPRELQDHGMNEKMIPLVIKKPNSSNMQQANAGSKFRLPFKNNGTQDLEIEFSFAKKSGVISGPLVKRIDDSYTPISPIDFTIAPGGTLKVPANGTNTLNLTAKFKNAYQLLCLKAEKAALDSGKKEKLGGQSEKYTHLLIGKVKDTSIMFSYIIEASVVEQNGPNVS